MKSLTFHIAVFCCIFVFIFVAQHSRAQITLRGIEDQVELQAYVTTVALDKYKDEDEELFRSSKVKADISKALKAKGYYNAQVNIDPENERDFEIDKGEIYTIQAISIEGYDGEIEETITAGDVLDAEAVLRYQSALFKHIAETRCYYNLDVKNEVFLDHEKQSANVHFNVSGEDGALFGETVFVGADDIKRKYLKRFIKYEQGACWSPKKLEDSKTKLLETGLLSSVDTTLPSSLPEGGVVPVTFKLKERAMRKIRLGGNYNTSEGPGVNAEWQHANYFGSGEKLSVKSRISMVLQSLGLNFEKPFFLSKKQSLKASAEIKRKDSDAFEEIGLNVQTSIKRKLSDHWTGNAGVALEGIQITDEDGTQETFGLVSLPASLSFDNRDSALNPHSGFSLGFSAEPFIDALGQSDPFLKTRISGSTYFDLSDSMYDPVIALRASLGNIWGADRADIPASERFYAGGGGSIRGFAYQEAGDTDSDGDPLGGKSLLETSAELRLKFTEKIGGVAFVDGGGAYDSQMPDFGEGFYIGAGVGARYYTDFGPLRFDVAVPVTKKENSDQAFQIYISIGQAF